MKDELDSLPDAQLAEVFAVEVAGWKRRRWKDGAGYECSGWDSPDGRKLVMGPPPFATSADVVLPHVAAFLSRATFSKRKAFWESIQRKTENLETISLADSLGMDIRANLLARVFCMALVKAARAQKGQP